MVLNSLMDYTAKKEITYYDTHFILNSFEEFLEESNFPTLYIHNDAYLFLGTTDITILSKDLVATPSDLIIKIKDFQDIEVDGIEIFTNTQKNLEQLVNLGGYSIKTNSAIQKSITFKNSNTYQETTFSNQILYFNLSQFEKIIYTQFYDPQFEVQATDDTRYLERRFGRYVGNVLNNQSLYK